MEQLERQRQRAFEENDLLRDEIRELQSRNRKLNEEINDLRE